MIKGCIARVFFIILLIFSPDSVAETKSEKDAPCDIHSEACSLPLSGGAGSVALDILPKPVRAMTDLMFSVRISGISSKDIPYIDLGMPGMKMGPNRVSLKANANGEFTGSGIIVRCPSGKTLWQATVTVPGAGTAEFSFNAVY